MSSGSDKFHGLSWRKGLRMLHMRHPLEIPASQARSILRFSTGMRTPGGFLAVHQLLTLEASLR